MSEVSLRGIHKSYGKIEVIHGVDLEIKKGTLTVLLGPSGCGKSTLLRMIAGLEEITSGGNYIDGELVNDMPPSTRGCAMVFQSYALYPHKTVFKNLAFPLKMAGWRRTEIENKVHEIAEILQILPFLDRLPRDLSGGQRQRVAMGRAMIRGPKVYLFDEPLSNLDAELRVKMRLEIASLQKRLSATMVYVTHDQVEAMTLAHQIAVMNEGIIEQVGSPLDVYNKPTNRFVASFLGTPGMNFISVLSSQEMTNGTRLELGKSGSLDVPFKLQKEVKTIGIRPENIGTEKNGAALQGLSYEVVGVEQLGDRSYTHLKTPAAELAVLGEVDRKSGTMEMFLMDVSKLHFFGHDDKAIYPWD